MIALSANDAVSTAPTRRRILFFTGMNVAEGLRGGKGNGSAGQRDVKMWGCFGAPMFGDASAAQVFVQSGAREHLHCSGKSAEASGITQGKGSGLHQLVEWQRALMVAGIGGSWAAPAPFRPPRALRHKWI